jgi:SAM-dependent methyltransferase
VLDVGCWTGGFLSLLNGMAKNMTAVDVEPAALEIAKSILPQARVIEASVLGLPFDVNNELICLLFSGLKCPTFSDNGPPVLALSR